MTSKTIEQAARAIEGVEAFYEGVERKIKSAQAAADAFGLLILPHDAEPMVGDVVEIKYTESDGNTMKYKTVYREVPWQSPPYGRDRVTSIKIIQRNGYASVIQEDE